MELSHLSRRSVLTISDTDRRNTQVYMREVFLDQPSDIVIEVAPPEGNLFPIIKHLQLSITTPWQKEIYNRVYKTADGQGKIMKILYNIVTSVLITSLSPFTRRSLIADKRTAAVIANPWLNI